MSFAAGISVEYNELHTVQRIDAGRFLADLLSQYGKQRSKVKKYAKLFIMKTHYVQILMKNFIITPVIYLYLSSLPKIVSKWTMKRYLRHPYIMTWLLFFSKMSIKYVFVSRYVVSSSLLTKSDARWLGALLRTVEKQRIKKIPFCLKEERW